MYPSAVRTILAPLLVGVLLCYPTTLIIAEETTVIAEPTGELRIEEETTPVVPSDTENDDDSATTSLEVESTSTDSQVADHDEVPAGGEGGSGSTTTIETPTADEETSSLSDLSRTLADIFTAEVVAPSLPATEVIAVYNLDTSIVIPVRPLAAVEVPAVPVEEETLLERVADTVTSWIFGDEEPAADQPLVPIEEIPTAVPDESVEQVDIVPSIPIEVVPEPTESQSEPQAWWRIFTTTWASELVVADSNTSTTTDDVVLSATDETVATSTVTEESTATEPIDPAILATSTTPLNDLSLVVSSTTPLVRLGTTSISLATLESTIEGGYTVVIPPGALPIGIHELHIATTTALGEINERVVVDVGGGAVTVFQLDSTRQVLVTTREDGVTALWLWSLLDDGSFSVTSLVPYGDFVYPSPLTLFDETLFSLSQGGSIVATDLVAGVTFSQTIERDGLAVVMRLRTGEYYVTPNELDFQFVSVGGALY